MGGPPPIPLEPFRKPTGFDRCPWHSTSEELKLDKLKRKTMPFGPRDDPPTAWDFAMFCLFSGGYLEDYPI